MSKISLIHQQGQSELTAFSTCLHIEKLLNTDIYNGLYFSHQLYEKEEYIQKIRENKQITITKQWKY